MRRLIVTCLIGCVFLAALPLSASQPDMNIARLEQVIPREMETRGWVLEADPFMAVDVESLSMVINGAAPRYLELGVKQAAFIYYKKETVFLMLEIFQTGSNQQAQKLYDEFATGTSQSLENLGTAARLTSELGGTFMTEYIQDTFYVRLSIDRKSKEARQSILSCARTISARIASTSDRQ